MLNGDPTVKQFGVGLAIAVALDATIVRCLLVPALMALAHGANWWFPRPLARVLPHLNLEGEEAEKQEPTPPEGRGRRPARGGHERAGAGPRRVRRRTTVEALAYGPSRSRAIPLVTKKKSTRTPNPITSRLNRVVTSSNPTCKSQEKSDP